MRALLIITLTVMMMTAAAWGRSIQSELSSRNVVQGAQIVQRMKRTPDKYGNSGYNSARYNNLSLFDRYHLGFIAANRMLNRVGHTGLHSGIDRT